jgi:hypothetical protein
MAPTRRADVRGELKRLGLALGDMKVAAALCDVLKERHAPDGRDWGEVADGLWTGLVVAYQRPFTNGELRLLEDRLPPLEGENLKALHDELRQLRDTVFAHSDNAGYKLPTISFHDQTQPPTAYLLPGGLVFRSDQLPAIRKLVDAQRERLEARRDQLLSEIVGLFQFTDWLTEIDAIPD